MKRLCARFWRLKLLFLRLTSLFRKPAPIEGARIVILSGQSAELTGYDPKTRTATFKEPIEPPVD